jgi:hypothetical protein
LLPREVAESKLGLSERELIEDSTTGMGVGPIAEDGDEEGFTTWSCSVPVTGQIVVPNDEGRLEAWGPALDLDPAFAEIAPVLLGRQDFFQAFAVTFEPARLSDPHFVLEY